LSEHGVPITKQSIAVSYSRRKHPSRPRPVVVVYN
jgi:hypothetical protein